MTVSDDKEVIKKCKNSIEYGDSGWAIAYAIMRFVQIMEELKEEIKKIEGER